MPNTRAQPTELTLETWVLNPTEVERQLEQLSGKCLDDKADRHDVAVFITRMIQAAITYREPILTANEPLD